MRDANEKLLEPGQTLKRVIAGRATPIGWKYKLIRRKWNEEDPEESLIADGGFIKELLNPKRAEEFEIV